MKKFLSSLLFTLGSLCLYAQPANDDCAGIIDLGEAPICPFPDTFTNVNATLSTVFSNPSSNIPACFAGGVIDRDVWFQFSVPASGDFLDFTISATGVEGTNGSILQPQIAVYRGDCGLDELQELFCATSAAGETVVSFDLLGLTPGLTYFLRVSDWSASASPNWGDFVLCVDEYDPVFNIGDVPSTESCSGTLYDSGGPNGDYADNEFFTFTICPSDFHQCIFIDVNSFNIETGFDNLTFFAGADNTAPQITNLTGTGGGVEIQTPSECVTVQFSSDISATDEGFELTWACSPDTCTAPPILTCDNTVEIPGLPYVATELSTCGAGNSITTSPCNNNGWLESDDYIFTYTSPGNECISVEVTNFSFGTGVGVFDDCPNTAANCLGQAGGDFFGGDPVLETVILSEPGTYYIVVDNNSACTPFDINIQPLEECPIVFPSAALCEDALSMNGCSAEGQSTIINVAPGEGDPNFVVDGINAGCWTAAASPANHTWFFFQAQADGNFGFILDAANPAEASDIDFIVWGPIIDPLDLCGYAAVNEPIRSSWAGGADPTGLADIHPILGIPVTDECEDAGGDDFVSTIPVLQNEYYVVLVNDWGGAIQSGAITLDFSGTTSGVLEPIAEIVPPADTVLCPGESVQLVASGGDVYIWTPEDGLSCQNCPDPIASPSQSTTYTLTVTTLCRTDVFEVEVGVLAVDAGPDVTVCVGEEFQIFAAGLFDDVTYQWTAPAGFLSCEDCPNPVVTALNPGVFDLEITATGPGCSFSDQMTLEVLDGIAPEYEINDDQQICDGDDVDLGGNDFPATSYSWTSVPPGFASNDANPNVSPSETTTYYLEITGGDCPLPSFDSILVEVSDLPLISTIGDSTICIGESIVLGATVPEDSVVYEWTPTDGLDDAGDPNTVATPIQTTQYTLTANRNGCIATESFLVSVVQLDLNVANPDTIGICRGESINLLANASPVGTVINWSPNDGSLSQTTGPSVTATPTTTTSYVAQIEVDGCFVLDTTYIGVDSVPWDLTIMPIDTQVCEGELVTLISPIYEPANFMDISFEWFGDGQITPDSLFNMVVQPADTTEYSRITTNGFCSDTSSVTVFVIPVASLSVDPAQSVICPGESVQLNVISEVGEITDFEWSPATGLSCTDCPDPVATPTATTNYMVEGEFEGCPVGASATVTLAAELFNGTDTLICPGESYQLNNVNVPGATFTWTSTDGTFTSSDPNPVVSPEVTTTYNLVASAGNCTIQASITVAVAGPFTISIDPIGIACPFQDVFLTATTSVDDLTIEWFDEGGDLLGTGSELAILNLPLTTIVTVQATDGCSTETDTYIIEVSPQFTLAASAEPDTVVAGSAVTLTATANGGTGIAYEWSDSEGIISNSAVTVVNPCETTIYTATATDANGCSQTASDTVNVINGFSIEEFGVLTADTTGNIYEGQEIQLFVETMPSTLPGATYEWYFGGELVSTTQDTISEIFNAPEVDGDTEFDIQVVIIAPSGCDFAEDGTVFVLENPVEVPNVFTPNSDGTNDFFLPTSQVPITIVEFQVWNRWGQLVYENENPLSGWDGTQDGEPALSDVYVYRIVWEITGGSGARTEEKGDVTLIR